MEEKSDHYDLGLMLPETEEKAEQIRQLAFRCVIELQKENNFPNFAASIRSLFESFGLKESPIEKNKELNQKNWRMKYDSFHSNLSTNPDISTYTDIEMYCEGAYANAVIQSDIHKSLKGKKRVFKMHPGECSLPRLGQESGSRDTPEINFYRIFEQVVGSDIELDSRKKYADQILQHTSDMFTFKVEEGGYKRERVLDRKPKLRLLQLLRNRN